jgi:hypothetical protein
MFKNIFKAAKNVLKSPVGQIGAAFLLPGLGNVAGAGTLANMARGIGSFAAANPMLTQAGIGLLAGDKPTNVLRNVAYGTAARGIGSMMQPGGTFMGGVQESLGMTPSVGTGVMNPELAGQTGVTQTLQQNLDKASQPGFLERFGLINPAGETFFDKYAPLLTLGQLGATVAAAALGEDQAKLLYDPNKNPYLASGREDKQDFYANINPYYSAATEAAGMKKGGVMDFPEKDGMIDGPGNGQSDDIPAMLSDGEFVMTKQAVMAAGDGDRNKGTKKMYEML